MVVAEEVSVVDVAVLVVAVEVPMDPWAEEVDQWVDVGDQWAVVVDSEGDVVVQVDAEDLVAQTDHGKQSETFIYGPQYTLIHCSCTMKMLCYTNRRILSYCSAIQVYSALHHPHTEFLVSFALNLRN